jgi:hypothetical protein
MQWIPKQIVAIGEDFHSQVGDGKYGLLLQISLGRIRQEGRRDT